jgi:hypothetical protein
MVVSSCAVQIALWSLVLTCLFNDDVECDRLGGRGKRVEIVAVLGSSKKKDNSCNRDASYIYIGSLDRSKMLIK